MTTTKKINNSPCSLLLKVIIIIIIVLMSIVVYSHFSYAYALENGHYYTCPGMAVNVNMVYDPGIGGTVKYTFTAIDGMTVNGKWPNYSITINREGTFYIYADSNTPFLPDYNYIIHVEHDYYDSYTIDQPATCTAQGVKSVHCKRCDLKKDETVIPAMGHFWRDEPIVDVSPTCIEDGIQSIHCVNCSERKEIKKIEKLGHAYNITNSVEPTCTTEGYYGDYLCSRCGDTIKTGIVLNALGHEFDSWQTHIAAECEKNGLKKRICEKCGYQESVDIPATGHNEELLKAIAPTCSDVGLTEGSHCSVCGEIIISQYIIPALGHNWGEWTVTKEATIEEEGAKTRICKNDPSHTETRVIPKKGEIDTVTRIFGPTRYETAIKAADAYKTQLGLDKFDNVIIACGTNYADALAGSYLSSVKKAPILLVRNTSGEIKLVQDYIKANLKSGGTIYMLGGSAVVPDASVSGLNGYTVKRLWGSDRYATNIAILKEAGITGDEILVASGTGFADSLSASATGKPILLVKNVIQPSQKAYVESLKGRKFYIIGGTGAVNADLETYFKGLGTVTRLGGSTRYETSVNVAKTFFPDPTGAVLAYGQNFPDGLCGGSLANAMGGPLILAANGKEKAAAEYSKAADIRGGAVLGGHTLIKDATVRMIFQMGASDKIVVK